LIIIIAIKWVLPPFFSAISKLSKERVHVPHEEGFLTDHPMVESKGSTGFQMMKIVAVIVIITVSLILINEVVPINSVMGSDPRLFPNTEQKEMIEFCENKFYLINSEWQIEDREGFMTGCVNGGAESTEFFRGYIPVEDRTVVDITNGTSTRIICPEGYSEGHVDTSSQPIDSCFSNTINNPLNPDYVIFCGDMFTDIDGNVKLFQCD